MVRLGASDFHEYAIDLVLPFPFVNLFGNLKAFELFWLLFMNTYFYLMIDLELLKSCMPLFEDKHSNFRNLVDEIVREKVEKPRSNQEKMTVKSLPKRLFPWICADGAFV